MVKNEKGYFMNADIERPPYEVFCECQQYTLQDYRCLGINNSHLYLIRDRISGKYNIYSLDYYVKNWQHFEKFLVENFKPVPLDIAWFLFPCYSLSEETYGF